MRKRILLLLLIIPLFTLTSLAQKQGVLTVNTKYTGIVAGYDYSNKTMVYVDGKLAGETSEQLQSLPNSCSVTIARGKHFVRIVNMANYQGNWEEHTLTNDYSIDALYEGDIKLKKELTISLVFDITEEKTIAEVR
jgi:hypothetical protein